jgi:hypothetical protein
MMMAAPATIRMSFLTRVTNAASCRSFFPPIHHISGNLSMWGSSPSTGQQFIELGCRADEPPDGTADEDSWGTANSSDAAKRHRLVQADWVAFELGSGTLHPGDIGGSGDRAAIRRWADCQ